MEDLYLVFDCKTKGVLCIARTASVANSVSLGFINSLSDMLPTSIPLRAQKLAHLDLKRDILKVNRGNLEPLEDHLRTPEFLEQRRVAGLRERFIYGLEAHLRRFTLRSYLDFDPRVMTSLLDQLNRSDPESGDYALGIREYAAIQDIDPAVAYQEIRLVVDTNDLIKIRGWALYNKYVNKFNQCSTEQQCQAVFDQAINDILYKAEI